MEKNNCGQYFGRERLQFSAQRDPLGKRMIFHKIFTKFYKKRKRLAPPKVKKYFWSRSKKSIFHFHTIFNEKFRKFFDLIFHTILNENFEIGNFEIDFSKFFIGNCMKMKIENF